MDHNSRLDMADFHGKKQVYLKDKLKPNIWIWWLNTQKQRYRTRDWRSNLHTCSNPVSNASQIQTWFKFKIEFKWKLKFKFKFKLGIWVNFSFKSKLNFNFKFKLKLKFKFRFTFTFKIISSLVSGRFLTNIQSRSQIQNWIQVQV